MFHARHLFSQDSCFAAKRLQIVEELNHAGGAGEPWNGPKIVDATIHRDAGGGNHPSLVTPNATFFKPLLVIAASLEDFE